jgi:flagellar assembly protein FliH
MPTVIKSGDSMRGIQSIAFNFEDISRRADRYLEEVRGQAAVILRQAQQEAEAVRRRAEEEGRQAAMRAVERVLEEKVGRQLATLLPALRQAADQIADARQEWLKHWEQTGVRLASAIAARLVRRELRHAPDIPLTLVREALNMAAGNSHLRIRLHPQDCQTLSGQIGAIVAQLEHVAQAEIAADETITRGGCRIETRHGTIDQQFEAQLARIEQELTQD